MENKRQNWYHIIPKNTGLSAYVWVIFCILPLYFVFKTASTAGIIFGIVMVVLFFTAYRLSFLSSGWIAHVAVSVEMAISIVMTILLGYVYFSLFLAFYIGNIQEKRRFITFYMIHLVTTIIAVGVGFFIQRDILFSQWPFIIFSILGVILLPLNMYNRNKRERLEEELKSAREKISELIVLEERHRIARDLHDTLGQKLSLIGLKSDLAKRLVAKNPKQAIEEIADVQQTARIALKEVREMVYNMKGEKLQEELIGVKQLLKAARIECQVVGDVILKNTPLLVENTLVMCLKEAITNVVKHSQATFCKIGIVHSPEQWLMCIEDDGIGITEENLNHMNNGIQGMRERLEFVNGSLKIDAKQGTQLTIQIPNVIKQSE
ncbi:two-component system sensor histidine kinase DesK [Cerasibacillus quisquiliarum]|uniref:histidine kinase n=1 Tax=Cerasibacillus quisquiliarum TaxID=227865 RepID=A0A511UW71_9BACI|nr:sensor histidine kinase [Cerasibacillus quisquiliarum]MBB5145112.1 two-component system sensor histidine kinase DesK [Cerasibacillus quisquiliarum]GEN29998.1 sensor histidine kinase DesK [Cerasibacillus quisquiliarum]